MSSSNLCEELGLNLNFFKRVFFESEKVYETLKSAVEKAKGIEEFFYPYVGAEIVKVLKEKNKIVFLKRIGSGRVAPNRMEKIDFLLEICSNSLGIELKIDEGLNGLMFGYQSSNKDKIVGGLDAKNLAKFFYKENLQTVNKCTQAKGKEKISDGLIIDYLKLGRLIECNFLKEGIVVGITKKAKKGKQCQRQELEKWLEEILNIAKEFVEKNNLTLPSNTRIEVYEKDDLILIWIYIYQ